MNLMNDLGTFLPTILASAFGGGLVAGAFGIYNRVASNKDEHEKWLRDQKVEAYGTYLSLAQALIVACSGFRGGQVNEEDTFIAFSKAQLGPLELLAPGPVREAAKDLEKVCDKIFHQIVYGSKLNDRENFLSAISEYDQKRHKFLLLTQEDLKISVPEYPMSGTHVATQE